LAEPVLIRRDVRAAGRCPSVFFLRGLLVFALAAALWGCSVAKPPSQEYPVLRTDDGLSLAATLRCPDRPSPPGVILVHRYGSGQSSWDGFAETLRQAGIMSIAVDLRGHGASRTGGDGKPLDFKDVQSGFGGWSAALADLRAAARVLVANGANPKNLAVAGEELGASLALKFALADMSMQAVVMISPGLDLYGLNVEDDIRRLKDCPVLIVTSENEAYSASSSATLKQAAPAYSEIQHYSGAALGTDIFAFHPNAMNQIVDWLRPILDPVPGK
jgi:dienelactone hydrolase